MHPVRGARDLLRLFGRLLLGRRLLGLPNHDELQHCSGRRGPTPTQIWGSEKVENLPRDYGRVERASKFSPCDGAGVQLRGAKRDGGARRRRACDTWGVKQTWAARRNPRRKARGGPSELAVTNAHLRALMRAHVGAYSTLAA
jgi:hypothetical protein